jgi:uncharacterized protein with HEPN domain
VKDDRLYLVHILECIKRIEEYTRPGRAAFLDQPIRQDAVLRNLHTLTESTSRLSEEIRAQRPDVDWRSIRGFRNVVVHDYLGVDIERIWMVIERDLPALKSAVRDLFDDIGD